MATRARMAARNPSVVGDPPCVLGLGEQGTGGQGAGGARGRDYIYIGRQREIVHWKWHRTSSKRCVCVCS